MGRRREARAVCAAVLLVAAMPLEGCAAPPRSSTAVAGAQPIGPTPKGQILWFEPAPTAGYEWSFFLYFPSGVSSSSLARAPLLVMPNNSGTIDDRAGVHRAEALKQLFSWRSYAERLHVALLVPAFPRPAARPDLYTHALDRDTLLVDRGELRRLDLQLLAMVAAAQSSMGAVESKILLFGFSAGGMFANRFALLHPEHVVAAAVGSPGGWPMAPQPSWKEQRLRYPLGSGDLPTVTGRPLDLDALRRVRFFFFLGANDVNDSLTFRDGYDAEDEALAMSLFGRTPVARWPVAQEMYRQARVDALFKLYPDVGHDVTDAMDTDVVEFFARAMAVRQGPAQGAGFFAASRAAITACTHASAAAPPPSPMK